MQLIALSLMEAEYIGLLEAIWEAISLINILQELKDHGYNIPQETTKTCCKVFKDNSGAILIAHEEKLWNILIVDFIIFDLL